MRSRATPRAASASRAQPRDGGALDLSTVLLGPGLARMGARAYAPSGEAFDRPDNHARARSRSATAESGDLRPRLDDESTDSGAPLDVRAGFADRSTEELRARALAALAAAAAGTRRERVHLEALWAVIARALRPEACDEASAARLSVELRGFGRSPAARSIRARLCSLTVGHSRCAADDGAMSWTLSDDIRGDLALALRGHSDEVSWLVGACARLHVASISIDGWHLEGGHWPRKFVASLTATWCARIVGEVANRSPARALP